jgi:hypothetical protein
MSSLKNILKKNVLQCLKTLIIIALIFVNVITILWPKKRVGMKLEV